MKLVIVESPTKAKTISKFLSRDYKVESSFGHVRDLPERKIGVDVKNNFEPEYVVPERSKKQVAKLQALAKQADGVILASDEDREGEAISWHLEQLLKLKENYQRITFHEITKPAIEHALANPRKINLNLVDAQQARRILDRLVGYELSPFLWKKVAKGLSAGRVQSVAVRLVVEKEREREKFKVEEYWTIDAIFSKENIEFEAKLHAVDGKTLKKMEIKNTDDATAILNSLKSQNYQVASVTAKEVKKNPPTPFTTSTLQQAANNKLQFSAKQTMMLAQQLYEGMKVGKDQVGLITYMRTDSLNLSQSFLNQARDYIKQNCGDAYLPSKANVFKTKSKGAQEAHEAIRPSDATRTPESIKEHLDENQFKLYELIWQRSLATQMTPAVMSATAVDIDSADKKYQFRATGQTIKFDGYLKIYPETTKENILPTMTDGDSVEAKEIKPAQHFTEPPARYTEASLVKIMEEYGIGRPSTYAPTLATIQDRGYVEKEGKALKPTDIGCLVNDILVEHFPKIVDYEFTAKMEKDLDEVELGEKKWQPLIAEFYGPFKENLKAKNNELIKTVEETDEKCEKCGQPMVIRTGRFGKFMACSAYPTCKNTRKIEALNSDGTPKAPAEVILLEEKCPDCGAQLTERTGRYGKFIGCSAYPKCKYIKKQSNTTGVTCPQCGKGEITGKFGRYKKMFYSCNAYPDCKFILPGRPTGEKCPKCQSLMIETANGPKCSNQQCV